MKHPHSSSKGMALIVVMASLIILATLGLAFLASVGTELQSSKTYSRGGSVKLLSVAAANLVMAQISEATKGGVDASGHTITWASQPGMIRTYDDDGNPSGYYKLFSWDNMTGAGAYDVARQTSDKIPDTWSSQTAVFTDLNQPLLTMGANGTNVYPIVDGNNLTAMTAVNGNKTYGSGNVPDIDGFYIAAAPVAPTANPNPVPMPVKWLYVLEDGTIVAPLPGQNGTSVTVEGATKSNQIIGRIAFWTDDETCKVNINTASEGVYWDTPRTSDSVSQDDKDLLFKQPVHGEYQRYPGHPATTSLQVVFKNLTPDEIYQISPRIGRGGSTSNSSLIQTVMNASFPPMEWKSDRLYASVDELLFKPTLSGVFRPPNNFNSLNRETLERAKFFITPNSRAPQLNLFGKPRISIWPLHINNSPQYRTAYDRAIAFCSTINHFIYYFQREKNDDPTHDLPAAGSGLGRNRSLLNYLRSLTSRKIPGFGGNFSFKYGAGDVGMPSATGIELDQILTEIFDYIRCTNLADSVLLPGNRFAPGTNPGAMNSFGMGQVVPIEDTATGTRGFGRYRTVEGASFLFIGQVDGDDPTSQVDSNGAALSPPVASGKRRIQAIFLPQLFDVSVGTPFDEPFIHLTITGLNQFTWSNGTTTSSMGLPASIVCTNLTSKTNSDVENAAYGDQMGFRWFIDGNEYTKFVSTTIDLPKIPAQFNFGGGDVTFTFRSAGGVILQTVKLHFPAAVFPLPKLADNAMAYKGITYNLRYFSVNKAGSGGRIEAPKSSKPGLWIFDTDVVRSVSANPGDIRLIAARKNVSDFNSTAYPFGPIGSYSGPLSPPVSGMHTLWRSDGTPLGGSDWGGGVLGTNALFGRLVKDQQYSNNVAPNFSDTPLNGTAVGKTTAFVSGDVPGDWDTGVAEIRDGPYINKPDEGDRGAIVNGENRWPYKWKYGSGSQGLLPTLFTPNRQIPSAVTFGSLPTGVLANKPWQTLLFRPGPIGHPGLGKPTAGSPPYTTPPDHLLLDLFCMPVVEPYVISEPLSEAGKISMNYQILPFTYINRDTGIRAVLKSEKVIAISSGKDSRNEPIARNYKINSGSPSASYKNRWSVDVPRTLAGFTKRFTSGDIFRCASEICDLDIVPENYATSGASSMDDYWKNYFALTGDNCRERIYATLYPRLTTQSNTYTIYYRVQSLLKTPLGQANVWVENQDKVTGEYRGSQTIERYIDANNKSIPDYTDLAVTTFLSSFYKFRVIQSKQFAP